MNVDFRDILLCIISAILCAIVLVTFAGCKAHKQNYQYTGNDYQQAVDSSHTESHTEIQSADSSRTENNLNGTITFADGGGTLTTNAGLTITGVQSIDGAILSSGQMFHVEHYIHDTTYIAVHDTLHQTEVQMVEKETESKAQNFWWIWLITGLVVGAGGIIALKKIPYTRPIMMWL